MPSVGYRKTHTCCIPQCVSTYAHIEVLPRVSAAVLLTVINTVAASWNVQMRFQFSARAVSLYGLTCCDVWLVESRVPSNPASVGLDMPSR